MKHIAKALIVMLVCMAALIGPSMAATIEIASCEGFGMIPLADGEYCQEMEVSNGPTFYVSENGMVQYLGDPVDEIVTTWFNYWTYTINPITGDYVTGGIHKLDVVLQPCAEVPACEWAPLRDSRIEIYEPTEIGQEIDISIRFPGNGAMSSRVLLDGVESDTRVWDGQSCIIVEALVNGVVYARDGIAV